MASRKHSSHATSSLATALAEGRAFDPNRVQAPKSKKPAATRKTTPSVASVSINHHSSVRSSAFSISSASSDSSKTQRAVSRKFRSIFSSSSNKSASSQALPTDDASAADANPALKPRTLASGTVVMEIVVPPTLSTDTTAYNSCNISRPTTSATHPTSPKRPTTSSTATTSATVTRPSTSVPSSPPTSQPPRQHTTSSHSHQPQPIPIPSSTRNSRTSSIYTSTEGSPSSSPTTALPAIPDRSSRRISAPRPVRPSTALGSPPGPAPSKPLPSLPEGIRASKRASQLQTQLAHEGLILPRDGSVVDEAGGRATAAAARRLEGSLDSNTLSTSPDRLRVRTLVRPAPVRIVDVPLSPVGATSPTSPFTPTRVNSQRYSIFPATYQSPSTTKPSACDAGSALGSPSLYVEFEPRPSTSSTATLLPLPASRNGPSPPPAHSLSHPGRSVSPVAATAAAPFHSRSQNSSQSTASSARSAAPPHEHLYVRRARPASGAGSVGSDERRHSLEGENEVLRDRVATLEARLMAVELRAKYLAAVFGDSGTDASGEELMK